MLDTFALSLLAVATVYPDMSDPHKGPRDDLEDYSGLPFKECDEAIKLLVKDGYAYRDPASTAVTLTRKGKHALHNAVVLLQKAR